MSKFGVQDKWLRKVLRQLDELGIDDIEIRQNNKIFVKGKVNDCPLKWSVSKTPSSKSATRQAIADLRRELKKCGVGNVPDFAFTFVSFPSKAEALMTTLSDWHKDLKDDD